MCINKRFEVKNPGIPCLVLIFNLHNLKTKILQVKNWFYVARYDNKYNVLFNRLIWTMNHWLSQVAESQATWVWRLQGAEIFVTPHPYCMALSQSVNWRVRFYIAALSMIFSLELFQWWSHTDRILTLDVNTRLPLFWSTWNLALGQDSAVCADLGQGQWLQLLYSLLAKVPEQAWPLFFLELLKILK